jgi:hypothetical protein
MGGGRVTRLSLMPDDADDYGANDYEHYESFLQHGENTTKLALGQAQEARDFVEKIRAGGYLRMPWPDIDKLVQAMLPGFLVAIGGRGKAGKTTLLRDCFTAWTDIGKTIVYVGTETQASILRLAWAGVRCGVPVETAIDPQCPVPVMEKLLADVEKQTTGYLAQKAIFGDCKVATVAELGKWVRFAKKSNADALIFDHFGRMARSSGDKQWQQAGGDAKAIKNLAKDNELLIVMGAQLTQGEGGAWLGEHEIPGNASWAATSEIHREVDIGLQVWRPFKPGITAQQKREARDDYTKVQALVQQNTMGVRVAAHRWKGSSMNQFAKLHVEQDQLHSWTARPEGRDPYV